MVVQAIWKLKLPTKLICFMWMCLNDCILTGVNFQKRGGIGPTACNLCLKNEETTTHLFVECPITQKIWIEITKFLKIENLEFHFCGGESEKLVLTISKTQTHPFSGLLGHLEILKQNSF
jgi:hypothetical protein